MQTPAATRNSLIFFGYNRQSHPSSVNASTPFNGHNETRNSNLSLCGHSNGFYGQQSTNMCNELYESSMKRWHHWSPYGQQSTNMCNEQYQALAWLESLRSLITSELDVSSSYNSMKVLCMITENCKISALYRSCVCGSDPPTEIHVLTQWVSEGTTKDFWLQ